MTSHKDHNNNDNTKKIGENKQKKLTQWVNADELIARWHVNELELAELIIKFDLLIYEQETLELPDDDSNEWTIYLIRDNECVFKLDEIEYFESKHKDILPNIKKKKNEREPEEPYLKELSPTEARELGQLRKEKKKWDKSIEAAIEAAIFCQDQKTPVTRRQLWNNLEKKGFANIPNTTFEKIWKFIPEALRNSGGRPKKA